MKRDEKGEKEGVRRIIEEMGRKVKWKT